MERTFSNTFVGGSRRRGYRQEYRLGSMQRAGWVEVSTEESDGTRQLQEELIARARRLSAVDADCAANCSAFCGVEDSDAAVSGPVADVNTTCQEDCLLGCTDDTGIANTTSTMTSTSTSTTTLPPPPVRLVQPSGDIFNVGDPLPQDDGFVVGRVEVLYDGHWGTVCSDGFDDVEATVVCRELGLTGTYARFDSSAEAGTGGSEDQTIWIDDVDCTGDEGFLSLCGNAGWGINNCWHTEDAKIWCESTSTTATTVTQTTTAQTTSTTTSFGTQTVTPRSGFIRQSVTGRCLGAASCDENAVLETQDCELFLPGTMQRWSVNTLGMIQNDACPGMCIAPEGATPVSWADRNMLLRSCNGTDEDSIETTEKRFVFHDTGFIQSQWSAKCLDTDGSYGYDGADIKWKQCELQGSCWRKGVQWDPLDMTGQSRSTEPSEEACQTRCASVAGCAHFGWWTNGGCHLQNSSATWIYNNGAYSGPPMCQEIITDQVWAFVEASADQGPSKGLLRNAEYKNCLDPQDLDASVVELQDCSLHHPTTDQFFELTSEGYLKNSKSGLCATIYDVTTTSAADGTVGTVPVSMQTCGLPDVFQTFQLDNKTSRLLIEGKGRCLGAAGSSDGSSLLSAACTAELDTADMSLSWEFVDTTAVAARCSQICGEPGEIFDIWALYDDVLDCQCGLLFKVGNRLNYVQEEQGSAELRGSARFGMVKPPEPVALELLPSTVSQMAPAQWPGEVPLETNMSLGIFSPELSIPQEIPESGDEPTMPFGFTYLSEAQTPYIDAISVNGVADTVNMTEGDSIVLTVRNFDGLMATDVKVYLGVTLVPSVTLDATTVSFTLPLATYGPLVFKVMAGWKGPGTQLALELQVWRNFV
ncbi:unnamed protein product [Effrenium voratum]|uniref:SRCR domain-containing protein n=1 Tax=Effrenium voratum TaxID=2562239 RepID=A0AA36HVL1_9DINO|nr:unnamed protein product [Effrenium voratum]